MSVAPRSWPLSATRSPLNHQVIDLYRHSAVDSENRAATRLTARTVWDPEHYVPHTMDAGAFRIGTATSGPAAGEDCAATGCVAQIKAVSRRPEAGLPSPNFTLEDVTFREEASTGQPVIEVRLASDLRGDRPTPITQATDAPRSSSRAPASARRTASASWSRTPCSTRW